MSSEPVDRARRRALPLLPAALCAIADGAPTAARRVALLRAIRAMGTPWEATALLLTILEERAVRPEHIRSLYALRALLVEESATEARTEEALGYAADVALAGGPTAEQLAVLAAATSALDGDWEVLSRRGIPGRPTSEDTRATMRSILAREVTPPHENPIDLFRGALPIAGLPTPGSADPVRFYDGLAGSISLAPQERIAVVERLGSLTQVQIDALVGIFEEERVKFLSLDETHYPQLRRLAVEFGVQWIEVYEGLTGRHVVTPRRRAGDA